MSKKTKYWIYIIPNYQWKDGSIGKIGVTDNLKRRAKEYKLESLTILEEHTNAKEVSKREIELQKQYGFKVDNREYWKTLKMQKKALTPEAQKKRVESHNFKESRSKIDWVASRSKIDWVASRSKVDWKSMSEKIDWEARTAKLKKPVNQFDINHNLIKSWDSATDAAQALGYPSIANISNCCRGIIKTYKKFIWKYA
jgi:hypothetical protein